jgi:hypothetical protein
MRRIFSEPLILIPGSILLGFFIGTIQIYCSFAYWNREARTDLFPLALWGGVCGAALMSPATLTTFYWVLGRRATGKEVGLVGLGTLVSTCLFGIPLVWISSWLIVFLTPLLMVAVSIVVKSWRPVNSGYIIDK